MTKLKWLLLFFSFNINILLATAPSVSVYHWSGYLPEAILQQFTEETGIKVYSSSYDSNEVLYTKLKAAPSHNYDVIMPSSYAVHRMRQEGMLMPLDKNQLSFKAIDSKWLNQSYDPFNNDSIPYLFSSSGLVLNCRYYHREHFNRWNVLWEKQFKNKLLLLDDVRELFSVALLVLGFSPNTQNPDEIHQAYEKLRVLLKNIRLFNSEGAGDLYATEEVKLGMGWSGDAYRANRSNPDVQFVYPEEGYILSIDNLAIPKGSKHTREAYLFINFLLRPDIAAKISLVTGYGTTNTSACDYLPPEFVSNKMVYPDAATLKKGIVQLSAQTATALYETYWERLKIEN